MMKGGERNACPSDISTSGSPPPCAATAPASKAGGRRTRKVTGIITTAATPAMTSIEVRQS